MTGRAPGPRHAADDGLGPGEAMVRVGAAMFIAGVVAVVVTVVPFLLGRGEGAQPGLAAAIAAVLLPGGLGLALLGLVRGARTRRREAKRRR